MHESEFLCFNFTDGENVKSVFSCVLCCSRQSSRASRVESEAFKDDTLDF
jgi:hypothetical protein